MKLRELLKTCDFNCIIDLYSPEDTDTCWNDMKKPDAEVYFGEYRGKNRVLLDEEVSYITTDSNHIAVEVRGSEKEWERHSRIKNPKDTEARTSSPKETSKAPVEWCSYCDSENDFRGHDVSEDGFVARCPTCGKEIFLCDECMHQSDNPFMRCDWESEIHISGEKKIELGYCMRGVTASFISDDEEEEEEEEK